MVWWWCVLFCVLRICLIIWFSCVVVLSVVCWLVMVVVVSIVGCLIVFVFGLNVLVW